MRAANRMEKAYLLVLSNTRICTAPVRKLQRPVRRRSHSIYAGLAEAAFPPSGDPWRARLTLLDSANETSVWLSSLRCAARVRRRCRTSARLPQGLRATQAESRPRPSPRGEPAQRRDAAKLGPRRPLAAGCKPKWVRRADSATPVCASRGRDLRNNRAFAVPARSLACPSSAAGSQQARKAARRGELRQAHRPEGAMTNPPW